MFLLLLFGFGWLVGFFPLASCFPMRPDVTRCCSAGQHPVFSTWTFGIFSPVPSPLWSPLVKPGHSVTPGEQHFTKMLNFIMCCYDHLSCVKQHRHFSLSAASKALKGLTNFLFIKGRLSLHLHGDGLCWAEPLGTTAAWPGRLMFPIPGALLVQ